jgi:hypothetical protein
LKICKFIAAPLVGLFFVSLLSTSNVSNTENDHILEPIIETEEVTITYNLDNIYDLKQKIIDTKETVLVLRHDVEKQLIEKEILINTIQTVPLYNQLDYKDIKYGDYGTVSSHGCAIVSLAMVSSYLLDTEYSVEKLAEQFDDYNTEKGSKWILIDDSAKELGLSLQEKTSDANKVVEALKNGQVVISVQSGGIFTDGGHFIVLTGITDDSKILVNDPYGANYTKNETLINGFANGFPQNQVFDSGKLYWIYNKK